MARATVAWQPEVERYSLDVSKVDAGPESCWWDDWGHKGVVWVLLDGPWLGRANRVNRDGMGMGGVNP